MSGNLRLAIVGLGKIAKDQHLPAIAGIEGAELVAIATRNATHETLPVYHDVEVMLREHQEIGAVVMCQPPLPRFDAARQALKAGKHVFLEKPPGATVSEVEALVALARECGVTLFASWHSRYAAAVSQAAEWLAARTLTRATITWKEDVRQWHPGQGWIWEPGGFGVFDPGINALSMLTEVVKDPLRVLESTLETPRNCQAPIAARLTMATATGVPVAAEFDFRQTGPQSWDIELETDGGTLVLGSGGNRLTIDGQEQDVPAEGEYPAMYRHFLRLIDEGRSDVDLAPLQLVADAFLLGRNIDVEDFHDR